MGSSNSSLFLDKLTHHVRQRTSGRIRNLVIEMRMEGIRLHGQTTSYYLKQLAQHGIRDILPYVGLENSIYVNKPDDSPGAA
jgi:hypothetical protein